jgi:hypothetical protein
VPQTRFGPKVVAVREQPALNEVHALQDEQP